MEIIRKIENCEYKGEEFDADAFGVRDIRFAIRDVYDVAESLGYQPEDREEQNAQEESVSPSKEGKEEDSGEEK